MLNRFLYRFIRLPLRWPAAALVLVTFVMASASAHALVINFDALPEGTHITNSVLPPGFTISTTNGNASHPHQAIVFDTACIGGCTGGDLDLKTPGGGIGNTIAQNKMMIIAQSVTDTSPADGLVDDPNDERKGGSIVLTFPEPRAVESLRFVDIETNETGSFVTLALAAGGNLTQAIPAIGNNSAQTLVFSGSPVATAMTIHFSGSGAVDDITIAGDGPTTSTTLPSSPCSDTVLDFESLPAGSKVSTIQTQDGQWVSIKGTNPRLGAAVNAAILYDSDCPGGCTGNDPDLGTPNEDFGGPGVGTGGSAGSPTQNDESLHNVLIVASNLIDTSPADGLVDNPNDQKLETVTQEINFGAFAPVSVVGLKIVDAGDTEGPAKVELFDSASQLIVSVNVPSAENNGLVKLTLPPNDGVFKMIVTFKGSGAIDDIHVTCPPGGTTTTVPQPTTTIVGGSTTSLPPTTTSLPPPTTTSVPGPTTTIIGPTTTSMPGPTTTIIGPTTTSVPGPTTTIIGPTTTITGSTTTSVPGPTTTIIGATTTLPPGICGDGVLNPGEQCDNGVLNSDTEADACRTNCTLPFCGDGVKDSNEFCEPGLEPKTPCTVECLASACPTQVEICNNNFDDDGDGLKDCDDIEDCLPLVPIPCGCGDLDRDPAYIRFNTKKGADYLSIHGRFATTKPHDLENERLAFALSNEHGEIWRGTLVKGEVHKRQGGKGMYYFRDYDARHGGPGDSDNFYRVGLRMRKRGGVEHCHFRIRAYGDFSLATEPVMRAQILVGDDAAATTQTWKRTSRGWVLHLRDFEDLDLGR